MPGGDQPVVGQQLERLAQRHDADPELAGQVPLGWQGGPGRPLPAGDPVPQLGVDPEVLRLPVLSGPPRGAHYPPRFTVALLIGRSGSLSRCSPCGPIGVRAAHRAASIAARRSPTARAMSLAPAPSRTRRIRAEATTTPSACRTAAAARAGASMPKPISTGGLSCWVSATPRARAASAP